MNEFELKHKVEFYEADVKSKLAIPMIINMCILASKHENKIFSIENEDLHDIGLGWIVLNHKMQIKRRPSIDEEISIKTHIEEYNEFFTKRVFLFYDKDGELIIQVNSLVSIIDLIKRKLTRLPEDILNKLEARYSKRITREKPTKNDNLLSTEIITQAYKVRYLDIDSNQHVNNVKYLEWIIDPLQKDFLDNHEIKQLNISFNQEVKYGEEILSQCKKYIGDNLLTKHQIVNSHAKISASAEITWN